MTRRAKKHQPMHPLAAQRQLGNNPAAGGAAMNVLPTQSLVATQWNGHGDHPQVARMDGHNWEWFPNEDDTDCGLLFGCPTGYIGLVNKGDWIVECPTLRVSRIFKPEAFARLFSALVGDPNAKVER